MIATSGDEAFVTLFAQGLIPFSVLLASSIAQDGHGMLPLLAESKRGFLAVKICECHFCIGSRNYRLFNGFLGRVAKITNMLIQVLMNKD